MNLKSIALDALEEADVQQEQNEAIKRVDNGDGTVKLSVSFELDPKVVAEKAKAMPKGVKRDDLSDDLAFSDDVKEDGIGEGKKREETAEDSLFTDALDELNGETATEDAKIGNHGNSPLENCRAKDPKFCPYHGQKAWTDYIDGELKKAGVNGATVTVNEDEHTYLSDSGSGRFSVDVQCNSGDEAKVQGVLQGLLAINGVKDPTAKAAVVGKTAKGTHAAQPGVGAVQKQGGAELRFVRDRKAEPGDAYGKLNEYIDDMIFENPDFDMSDPETQTKLDDLAQHINDNIDPLLDQTTGELKDPVNDQTKYNDAIKTAFEKYHVLSSYVKMPHVKSVQDAGTEFSKSTQEQTKVEHQSKSIMDDITAIRDALGWKQDKNGVRRKPNGAQIDGHEDFGHIYGNLASFSKDKWVLADAEFGTASQNNDVDKARCAAVDAKYAADNGALLMKLLEPAALKYKQGLYDWAQQNSNSGLATAFPNGRPQ